MKSLKKNLFHEPIHKKTLHYKHVPSEADPDVNDETLEKALLRHCGATTRDSKRDSRGQVCSK